MSAIAERMSASGHEVDVWTVSAGRGPVAIVVGGVHGDELTGVAAARRLVDALPTELVRGTVHLVPSANPVGLRDRCREVGRGGADLNRLFPGTPGDRRGAGLAALLWRVFADRRPDVVLDLHADSRDAVPYAILDRPVAFAGAERRRLDDALLRAGRATGLFVLHDHPDELYLKFGLDRSLAGAVVNRLGVPAVTIEVGPRRVLDEHAVDVAMGAVRGVLASFGLVADLSGPPVDVGAWRRRGGPKVSVSGLFRPLVAAGAAIRVGQTIAEIVPVDDTESVRIDATFDGMIVAWSEEGFLRAGDTVGTFAVPEVG